VLSDYFCNSSLNNKTNLFNIRHHSAQLVWKCCVFSTWNTTWSSDVYYEPQTMLVAIFDWLRYRFHSTGRIRYTLCHLSFTKNNMGFSIVYLRLHLQFVYMFTWGILAFLLNRKSVTVTELCGDNYLSLSLLLLEWPRTFLVSSSNRR